MTKVDISFLLSQMYEYELNNIISESEREEMEELYEQMRNYKKKLNE